MIKIFEKYLSITSSASICALLFIWVLPNTIALRHVLLATAFISAVGLIYLHWNQFKKINFKFLPLFCIFGLFIWVLIHYCFFSLNPSLELSEIKGLWLRSLAGTVAAIGLAISIIKSPKYRLYFYIALFSTPAVNVISYCWASYLNGELVKPNDFVRFLFNKIETAYFGGIAGAVATGNLIHLLLGKIDRSELLKIFWCLLGLALVLISALISSTKNGIAIALGLCLLLARAMIVNTILNQGISKTLSILVLVVILLLAGGVRESHKSLAYKGWDTVFQDASLGLDIDTNLQWQKGEGTVPMPTNSLGVPAAINTYTRFAYAAVGIRLIAQYPLGYGSINQSFKGLQVEANVPHEHGGQVHSGWIDFGLAFGIPGLILIFSTMISIIYFGLKSRSAIVLPWMVFCLAFIPFGLIAEITYKQYFEATIFFLTLASSLIILEPKNEA